MAELKALLQALLRAPLLRDVASDCAFVVKVFSRRRWEGPSSNGDIWHLIGEVLSSTLPIVRKVKAHTSFEDLRIELISYLDFYGDAIADGLAGRGAEEFATSATDAANVGLLTSLRGRSSAGSPRPTGRQFFVNR